MLPNLAMSLLMACAGCDRDASGSSCASIQQSRNRQFLLARYVGPSNADLGDYRLVESWVEHHAASGEDRLVVRLQGPHVDDEPRVQVVGLEEPQYRGVWSERGGPPYEVWLAPKPLPEVIKLKRGEKQVELRRERG